MRKFLVLSFVAVLALMVLTAATPQSTSAAAPSSVYYVVRHGDTLASIAYRYGMSTWAIARANGIWNPNYIYAGQVLYIPCAGCWYPPQPPCPGCPWPPSPHPAPQPMPGPIYRCMYRVQYGDSMSAIAYRLGVDVWTLARANNIYNLNWIYAGQWLRVPGCYG